VRGYGSTQFLRWRLSLAEGESKYDDLEKKIAMAPVIAVPTVSMEGDANGAPHFPNDTPYRGKFSGKYEYRVIKGRIGHNLPQEAPQAFRSGRRRRWPTLIASKQPAAIFGLDASSSQSRRGDASTFRKA
jgi:hypothetical protein